MYCSECGARADGKFCWKCGQPLRGEPGPPGDGGHARSDATVEPVAVDWSEEVCYSVLGAIPAVREQIARHAAEARTPLSGETLIKVVDKLAMTPVSLGTISELSIPLWESLGLQARMKTRTETIARPCGHVIVATLCSLARNNQSLQRVDQGRDGCSIHASQASDLRSLKGELIVTIKTVAPGRSFVDAGARSKGQYYDWGKSNACLDRLFQDLRALNVAG